MKRRYAAVVICTAMAAATLFTGCGNATYTVDGSEVSESEAMEAIQEVLSGTEADDQGTEDQEIMEYLAEKYKFNYESADFIAHDDGNGACTVSYINEDVEAAGSNVVSISVETGDAAEVLAAKMEELGVTDYQADESYFGADGITALSATTGAVSAEGSELTTDDTIYTIQDMEDVIVIDVFRTIGPDEDTEMAIDDSISTLLDTFALADTTGEAYQNEKFGFHYLTSDFALNEDGDNACTLSYCNEAIQVAGSNVVQFEVETGTTYDKVLTEKMAALGITEFDTNQSNFGADGIEAYIATTGTVSSEDSELTTSETIFAIPDGDDVIVIDVFRTIGTEETDEMAISDAISEVLDTFTLVK